MQGVDGGENGTVAFVAVWLCLNVKVMLYNICFLPKPKCVKCKHKGHIFIYILINLDIYIYIFISFTLDL